MTVVRVMNACQWCGIPSLTIRANTWLARNGTFALPARSAGFDPLPTGHSRLLPNLSSAADNPSAGISVRCGVRDDRALQHEYQSDYEMGLATPVVTASINRRAPERGYRMASNAATVATAATKPRVRKCPGARPPEAPAAG